MKGIAHFTIGVAAASCLPAAVKAGACGNPLYFILGGVFGLLPDTLDFKLYRYLYRHDVEVVPDPLDPDPTVVAEAVSAAMRRAHGSGRPVRLKLNTIREGVDAWRRYHVRFNVSDQRIEVAIGPTVDTGAHAIGEVPDPPRRATTPIPCPLQLEYQSTTTIDIFDGPVFRFVPTPGNTLRAEFIPWHRQWTHSLLFALVSAALGWLFWDGVAAAVIALAVLAHVAADQLGFLGSNVLWLLRKGRTRGAQLMQSSDTLPNLLAVWLSCMLVFWNLYSVGNHPGLHVNFVRLVVFGFLAPLLSILGVRRALRRGTTSQRLG